MELKLGFIRKNFVRLMHILSGTILINCLAAAELPSYTAYKTDGPVKIEGLPDEAECRAPSQLFLEIEKGGPALYPVKAKMLWDDNYLYVSFKISDPNIWSINILRDFPMAGKQQLPCAFLLKERELQEHNPYTENFVKIYLDHDNDGRNYTETHVNPLNTVCDKWQETPWRRDVKHNKFVPFVGVYSGDKLKTSDRFRTEIRIAALADNGTIMFAFNEAFKKHPELVKIVAEELSNDANKITEKEN